MVGIVVVSHSSDLAEGLAALAGQMAGPDVRIEPAGGLPERGASEPTRTACARRFARRTRATASSCSATSAARSSPSATCSSGTGNGSVRLVDAPIVEGAVAAAVTASANMPLDDVVRSAEEARGAGKL